MLWLALVMVLVMWWYGCRCCDGGMLMVLWLALVLWGYGCGWCCGGIMVVVVMRYLFWHGVDKLDCMGYNISM